MTSKVMPHNSTTLEEMDPKQENNKLVKESIFYTVETLGVVLAYMGSLESLLTYHKDVDEKLLYETFSVFGVIVTNPKDGFKNGSDMPIVMVMARVTKKIDWIPIYFYVKDEILNNYF
ncbi:hypothetical protein ZEAMMB73_Zm00001d052652 [Zea mays]|uniref:Uncharacterized protein n=1 Tax=Zea mays TaxID=4577 RepID=A0A1D6QI87_MAIZE|nr:hypothetical protein ZEAMMB73_Zm00001d052652 [Zea mays]